MSQMNMMRMMVVKGRACVDWWYQATVFTRLHMKKKGTAGEETPEYVATHLKIMIISQIFDIIVKAIISLSSFTLAVSC